MIVELGLAALVLATVALHGLGLLVLAQMVRHIEPPSQRGRFTPRLPARWPCWPWPSCWACSWPMAWRYGSTRSSSIASARCPNCARRSYFSTSSYAAIGYGDDVIAEKWKLLGAIEGVNGVILLGWSVAFFVTAMTRFAPTHHKERSDR